MNQNGPSGLGLALFLYVIITVMACIAVSVMGDDGIRLPKEKRRRPCLPRNREPHDLHEAARDEHEREEHTGNDERRPQDGDAESRDEPALGPQPKAQVRK